VRGSDRLGAARSSSSGHRKFAASMRRAGQSPRPHPSSPSCASDAAAALQADWMATRASNKTSNKASNTKIGWRSKALICIREFERKFGTGALHPLRFSTLLYDFARFSTLLNAMLTRQIMRDYSIDLKRVYLASLSAGGADAAIMAATYADLYTTPGLICDKRSAVQPVLGRAKNIVR
jgi:hypothetical protein